MAGTNLWQDILDRLRTELGEEDFRRWFAATAYAGDSGGQLTVWVPSEAIRVHVSGHYQEHIDRALAALGRSKTLVRFRVAGFDDDDDEDDDA